MKVEIDKKSGFCFGVTKAVEKAEVILKDEGKLFCLGEIVHNQVEVGRLANIGLVTIDRDQYKELKNCKVLIRAHGEPPETYEIAKQNNIELIDATCPVVLKLQQRIKKKYHEMEEKDGTVLIYGKKGHAEVTGLEGQTGNKAVVVREKADLKGIDFKGAIRIFSQTTMSIAGFEEMSLEIKKRMVAEKGSENIDLEAKNTVCGQVSCREPGLKEFSGQHDVILFVSGKNSSNGKMLFQVSKRINENSHFISSPDEIDNSWFQYADSVGVCGATSTPVWLMQQVVEHIKKLA